MQGLLAFQRYFQFSGRSARAEYWQFIALFVAAVMAAYVLDLAIFGPYRTPAITTLVVLGFFIPSYSVAFRRLHDRGRSGWWIIGSVAVSSIYWIVSAAATNSQFTPLGDVLKIISYGLTLVNLGFFIFLVVHLVQRGDEFTNQYGPDPLIDPILPPTFKQTVTIVKHAAGSTALTTAATTHKTEDPLEQIERLAKLRDAGLLTNEEFAQ